MSTPLRVGIIGASATGGWAQISHVPAIKAVPGLELAAVGTTRQETADAAAKAFGAPAAYGDAMALIRAADIDLVAIVVRAPAHRELVLAALEAGKHVYCEWPLGRDTAEAEEMAVAARSAGVRAAVGLQARCNPTVCQARQLLAAGAIGRVLSASVSSATVAWGPEVPDAMRYAEDPANGVNLVTIQGAHTIDLAIALAGELEDLSALTTRQFGEILIGDAPQRHSRSTFDHILLNGRLAAGGSLGVEVAGGRSPATPFRLELVGERGIIVLDGGAPRGFQSGNLSLSLNGGSHETDPGDFGGLPEEAINVAGLYAALRDDIVDGTATAPDFDHALRLSRLVDALFKSSESGTRQSVAKWPQL